MEALQFFQFYHINECGNPINYWLTVAGFVHICFQPFFTHLMNFSVVRSKRKQNYGTIIKRLAIIQGFYMFSRWIFVDTETYDTGCASMDWINGEEVCTYLGNYHLAWKLPLRNATYFWPTNNTHFFMMFAPFLAMGPMFWIPGAVLFGSGPYLASLISDNLHEQASIWCFFSIAQICLLVLYVFFTTKTRKNDPKKVKTKAN
jgi:hypothetical protein